MARVQAFPLFLRRLAVRGNVAVVGAPFTHLIAASQGLRRCSMSALPAFKRSVVEKPLHDLVGDESVPGLFGGIGVKTIARQDIKAGTVVFQEGGEVLPQPSMHSIQIDVDRHLAITGETRFLSHSFEPNCRVRVIDSDLTTHPVDVVAIRDIAAGEDLSFDYTTNEWEMGCGFVDCKSGLEVRGFKHLAEEVKRKHLEADLLPPHILKLWSREQSMSK